MAMFLAVAVDHGSAAESIGAGCRADPGAVATEHVDDIRFAWLTDGVVAAPGALVHHDYDITAASTLPLIQEASGFKPSSTGGRGNKRSSFQSSALSKGFLSALVGQVLFDYPGRSLCCPKQPESRVSGHTAVPRPGSWWPGYPQPSSARIADRFRW